MINKNNLKLFISIIAAVIILVILFYFRPPTKLNENYNQKNKGNGLTTQLEGLINKTAPNFSLTDLNGKIYSLENLRGKNIILFFNEGLMCYPACWNQIAAFGKDKRFEKNNTIVLSVVIDPKEGWRKAINQMPDLAKAIIVFDEDARISEKYGVLKVASSMHYGVYPGHTYVLIDKEGIVRYIFDDPNMAIHNDKLLNEISKLEK